MPAFLSSLALYGKPRMAAMLALGFSAGLPFLLVFGTLSAWLTDAGLKRATIGLLSWIGITYSIKFFWAPVVDRLPIPVLTRLLGRRRSWLLLAQTGIVIGLWGMSGADPVNHLAALVWLALLVAFSAATQDICVDAWRIESAGENEVGSMAAAYQLGYRLALLVANAGALWIAGTYGWVTAYLAMAAIMSLGIITTLLIKEPELKIHPTTQAQEDRVTHFLSSRANWPVTARRMGAWFISAVVCPFIDFFSRNGIAKACFILAFVGTFRLTDITMGVMANPFYLDMGYTLKEIASVAKGAGVIASIIGVFAGGWIVSQIGVARALIVGGVLVIVSNLAYIVLAQMPSPDLWALWWVVSGDNFAYNVAGTAFIAYLSGLTNTAYTATQYALFSSIFTLPGKLLAGGSGWVVDQFGYPSFFVYTSLLGVPALLLAIALTRGRFAVAPKRKGIP